MSYDFRLFKRKEGEDLLETARADSNDFATTAPDPQKETLKRCTADALIACNPQLEIFQFDYEAIAKSQKITVEEARRQYRHLELNGPSEDETGIQIILFDDEASVTVPYWHDGSKVEDAFREIWNYLETISRETGYLIYDPQIDQVIDPSAGFDKALACYTGTMRQIQNILPKSDAEKKSWWKFW